MSRPHVVNVRTTPADVFIGRPSKWGNPFVIGKDGSRTEVISKYHDWIQTQPDLLSNLYQLKSKTLGCFCAPLPCHGDVLANLVEEWESR